MANVIYNSFKQKIMDGSIDLENDTIKVALVTSSYTPDQDNHEDFADITNEVSGTEGVFDADDVTWSNSTITARGAVVYKDSGTPATSWLICYIDFGSDYSSVAGDFKIAWNSEGIVNIT